jgi:hypothetical protein
MKKHPRKDECVCCDEVEMSCEPCDCDDVVQGDEHIVK